METLDPIVINNDILVHPKMKHKYPRNFYDLYYYYIVWIFIGMSE